MRGVVFFGEGVVAAHAAPTNAPTRQRPDAPPCRSGVSRDPSIGIRSASRDHAWIVPDPDGIPIGILPRVCSKPCANRVHQDVPGSFGVGLVATQCAVVECRCPDAGSWIEACPHLARRVGLQASNGMRQGFASAEVHQTMPVIRHQDPGQEDGSPPETVVRDCPACACGRIAVVEQRRAPMRGEGDEVCAAGQRHAAAPECGMTGRHWGKIRPWSDGALSEECGLWGRSRLTPLLQVGAWVGRGLRRSYKGARWGVGAYVGAA